MKWLKNWMLNINLSCWKIPSVCRSYCISREPVHVLIIQLSWESMSKQYATGFPKWVPWTSTISAAETGGLEVSSALLLELPAFLDPFLMRVTFSRPLSRKPSKIFWSLKRLRNGCVCRMNRMSPQWNPENWTQPVYANTAQGLISWTDDKCSKLFTAHKVKFGSQCLSVVSCKNLGPKFDNQQLWIPIGLRLGALHLCCAYVCKLNGTKLREKETTLFYCKGIADSLPYN